MANSRIISLLVLFCALGLLNTEYLPLPRFLSGLIPIFTLHHNKTFHYSDLPEGSLTSKVALVTGANSGMGFWNSYHLAKRGATVALACRSLSKCQEAIQQISAQIGSQANLVPFQVDLGNLSSVASFAKEFQKKFTRLDIFIQNAGMGLTPFALGPDGIETSFATNHLGHFKMTKDLQPLLIKTSEEFGNVSVVMVSSCMHWTTHASGIFLELSELNDPKNYDANAYYSQSKLANILFSQELSFRLKDKKNIFINSCHPGLVATNILTAAIGRNNSWLDTLSLEFVQSTYALVWPAEDGAFTQFYLGAGFDFLRRNDVKGRYFHPQVVEILPSYHTKNATLQKGLWEFSERLLKERGF